MKLKLWLPIRFWLFAKKQPVKILGIVALFFLSFFFLLFLPARRLVVSASQTLKEARALIWVAKQQDLYHTKDKLQSTKEGLRKTKEGLSYFSFLKFFPLLGRYYKDASSLILAGEYLLQAGEIALQTLTPYANLLGFSGEKGSFVQKSGEERLETVVMTLDKLRPSWEKVGEKVRLAQVEIDKINPSFYPYSFAGKLIRPRLEDLKETSRQIASWIVDTQPLVEVLPDLLGQKETKKYLVLFQNDKELRPTGGFITAYAIFRLEKGKIVAEQSEDIYLLDERLMKRFPPPEPIFKYLPKVYSWHLRDSNLSPDFYLSAKKFEEMYQYVRGREKINGIVAIDTYVLQRLIDVLGPIQAYGIEFSNKIIPSCNCPQVIWELEKYAEMPVGYMRRERKGIIGVLINILLHKALNISPGEYWPKLLEALFWSLKEKHILLYFPDEKLQKAVERLGFGGRIKDFAGDYLHINDCNFAGAKSNMYVKEEVEQKIEINKEGEIVKTLILKYRNPQPPDDCSLERTTGLCLSATLRNWIRIYVPRGSKLLESGGSKVPVEVREDLGKTYFEGFFEVRPLGSAQFFVQYKLPFKIRPGEEYRLFIQKQPGTEGEECRIFLNGREIEKFRLTQDREVKFRI